MVTQLVYHPHRHFYRQVTHANGVVDVIDMADGMVRPLQMSAQLAGSSLWDSGLYAYDGAGNIESIGESRFIYDLSSRLKRADVVSAGVTRQQNWTYDSFGNITEFDGVPVVVDSDTNRLSAPAIYDGRGNLIQFSQKSYTYDALGRLLRFTDGQVTERYIYDATGLRLATLRPNGFERWTIRDQNGAVLKEYQKDRSHKPLKKVREYVYGGRLFGAYYTFVEDGTFTTEKRHYHLDHLGSTRLITDPSGGEVSRHDYFAYGQEIIPEQGDNHPDTLKFTGQERDADDRDYFKARYYLPLEGRFMSPDPVLGTIERPQSWNRYTYVLNNPLKFNDPTGETFSFVFQGFSDLLSELLLFDPTLFFLVDQLSKLDDLLAAFDNFLDDLAAEAVGESDALALLVIAIDELAVPDNVSQLLWEVGTARLGVALKSIDDARGILGQMGGKLDLDDKLASGVTRYRDKIDELIYDAKPSQRKHIDELPTKPPQKLTRQQRLNNRALELGYRRTNYRSHGQPVFYNGRNYITPDIDGHNGGAFKMARTVRELGRRQTRMGTYDENLQRIGD